MAFNIQAVTNPNFLYGWSKPNQLLDQLILAIRRGNPFFLQGERRSGKTSLLNCLRYRIEKDYPNILPVLIDCQILNGRRDNRCIDRAYRYLISVVAEYLMQRYDRGETWITPSTPVTRRNIPLSDLALFEKIPQEMSIDLIQGFSDLMRQNCKALWLLFDEYEYFSQFSPEDNKNSFSPLRSQQDRFDPDLKCGMSFILSGAEPLNAYCNRIGSPQFNLITWHPVVPPLEYKDIEELWNASYEELETFEKKNIDDYITYKKINIDTLHEMCGGRPSYIKLLGQCLARDGIDTNINVHFSEWFSQIFERQTSPSKDILLSLAADKPIPQDRDSIKQLLNMYLIKKNPDDEIGGYVLYGGLWCDYLRHRLCGNDMPEFYHAGDLANHIIDNGLLVPLLEMQKGRGEKSDWLEFKACLVPSQEQMEIDFQNSNKKYQIDDYKWHVVKAILAMRYTRGGLIILGINDDATNIIGVRDNRKKTDTDFIRETIIRNISQKTYNTLGGETQSLEHCSWHIGDTGDSAIRIEKFIKDGKTLIAIAVSPDIPSSINNLQFIKSYPTNRKKFSRDFILVRSKNTENIEIVSHESDRLLEHITQMQSASTDDLKKFYQQLLQYKKNEF